MSYSRDLDRAAAEYGEISSAELARMIEEEGKELAAAARAGRRRGGFRQHAMEHCLAVRFGAERASFFDHPYWYRRRGKAAALVAHLYCLPNAGNQERCEAIASRFGCLFETPDFPSWWNPGGTVLVAYVGPAGR
jgi:hypothetical protein